MEHEDLTFSSEAEAIEAMKIADAKWNDSGEFRPTGIVQKGNVIDGMWEPNDEGSLWVVLDSQYGEYSVTNQEPEWVCVA